MNVKIGWKPLQVQNISNIYNNNCNNNNSRHKKVYKLPELQTERMATQLALEEFRSIELHVPPSRLEYAKGFPFKFELGRIMV